MRIASQIPESEIVNLKNIFGTIDKNGNGLISMKEMILGMDEFAKLGVVKLKKKEILALFKAIDIDESGSIDYTEFIASFMGTKASTNEKYLQTTF